MKYRVFIMNLAKLQLDHETNLHYQLAYRLVGEPPWLEKKQYRDGLVKELLRLSVQTDTRISHIQIVDIGLSFQIELSRRQDLNRVVNYLGLSLARALNRLAPELELGRLVQGRSISGIWHRPYLVRTVTPHGGIDANSYLGIEKGKVAGN